MHMQCVVYSALRSPSFEPSSESVRGGVVWEGVTWEGVGGSADAGKGASGVRGLREAQQQRGGEGSAGDSIAQ